MPFCEILKFLEFQDLHPQPKTGPIFHVGEWKSSQISRAVISAGWPGISRANSRASDDDRFCDCTSLRRVDSR